MPCTVHDTVEGSVYPYRCARCGGCFICQHRLKGRLFWVCADGVEVPATMSPGWPVSKPFPPLVLHASWWSRLLK